MYFDLSWCLVGDDATGTDTNDYAL